MSARLELCGRKYGMLTAVSCVGVDKRKRTRWTFLCDCGTRFVAIGSDVKNGHTTSCGCTRVESSRVHGDAVHGRLARLYIAWRNMLSRCEQSSNWCYKHYGGRGIVVCGEWHDYASFKRWALGNGYGDDLQIDRINNDGNYEPSNCRWITRLANMSNTSVAVSIDIHGETACMSEWARRIGKSASTIHNWIKKHGIDGASIKIADELAPLTR